jgi:outer membrane protein TolC
MGYQLLSWKRVWFGVIAGLTIPLFLVLTTAAQTPDMPREEGESLSPAAESGPILSLADCLRIAHERQPALDAYRASLAAADTNSRSLQSMRLAALFVHEIPIRREQACLGVTAASARLEQVERETDYAVTRTYFGIVYAREQKRVATKVVDELSDALENAKRLVKGGAKKPTQNDVDKTQTYVRLAELKLEEANTGIERAAAGLREAMGVGPDYEFQVALDKLPELDTTVNRREIINLALSRRPEMTQAAVNAEVTSLEVDAQGKSRKHKNLTAAAVVDLHAQPLPQGSSDGEYRPGAVGPEMPTTLVGNKRYRQERARDFNARAAAVMDKTRNLIILESEDAFLKWKEASAKVAKAREAADGGDRLAKRTLEDFKALGEAVEYKEVLEAEVLAGQAGAQFNEAKYKLIIALAGLERVTGGGFRARLAGDH